jgi:hypothetical protein
MPENAPFPINLDLHMHFVDSGKFAEQPVPQVLPGLDPDQVLLTKEQIALLLKIEPEVMEWLSASQDNVAKFASDPLGALLALKPELDRDLVEALRQAQQSARSAQNWPEEVTLRSIKFSAGE